MTKITLNIKTCKECPHCIVTDYSTDGWDRVEDWLCKKKDRDIIIGVDWHRTKNVRVPKWCPVLTK